ncbi:MAG: xanthine dehydrogenase family protein molybdopterin-binding subunit [Geminicoccaceae bacterium]|nr:xanthine dehydrogenase family protein molybdopterin-binding subunit [Geminicoccaceae bacterium]
MAKFGIGQPVRRVEDQRLVTGRGRFTDDVNLPGQVYGFVVRSPHAHARIRRIDTSKAMAAPGVLAVLTAADVGGASIPCFVPITNRDGSKAPMPAHPILCRDKVRYVGDKVAFVVAETRAQARDAAELVEVDYEPLEGVVDTAAALGARVPPVHEECPGNLAFDWHFGDERAVAAAFAKAARRVRLELVNNRLVCNPMEPRAAVAEWDAGAGKLTVHTCTQGGWAFRDVLAQNLGLAKEKVRVLTPDVGGGFGMKAMFYGEYTLCAFAARKLGRPVKWTSERGEAFLSDSQGRDHVTVAELAFDADHRILGLKVDVVANMGAYYYFFAPFIPTGAALKVLPGVYDVKCLSYGVKAVFTNTVPVDAYRGAGRPESIYCIERLMDLAAAELGVDRLELRRKNFIRPEQMPFKTAAGEIYDSGDFERVMNAAVARADWQGFPTRRAEAARRGKLRGIGLCYYIESTMGNPVEHATVRFTADGAVEVLVGTQSNGQGHETAYAQVLVERLGVPFEKVRIVQGDTDAIADGGGTGGSRSLTAEGVAILEASDRVIEKGKVAAAHVFETAVADITFEGGTFRVAGTDRAIGILELAERVRVMASKPPGLEEGLDASASIELDAWTFPNGCHVAEVEVDPETGVTRIVRYTVVDDFGVVVNPLLVEGQVHGGVVQGIGQALLEHTVYDRSGQLLTGSFMDYCMPRADDLPSFDFSTVEVRCRNNPLGVKGCGEAGSVGSCAAVINALVDALSPLGVRHVDMPALPEKVWRLAQGARRAAA